MQPKLYPRLTLALLTALNILNYVDRSVLWAVQEPIKDFFRAQGHAVSDAKMGLLTTTFFWFYMCAAPFIGYLGDRFPRRHIIAVGIFIWSGFTLYTWYAHTFGELLFRHVMVGIGEASYVTIAPTLIADLFPVERRGRMIAIFSAGLPFGTALGYVVGGSLAQHFHDWRVPFMFAGLPGFLLALVLWFLPEPSRGRSEKADPSARASTLPGLARNRAFLSATLGLAMYTFAMGGLQAWMPTFLMRTRGMSLDQANLIFGGITCFNGIVATLLGGWMGDRMLKRHDGAYYTFSGVAMFISVPLMLGAFYASGKAMYPAIFLAEFFLLVNTGPVTAALVNSVGAEIRATAMAVNVFVIHLLGDASSPSIIGWISDRTSLRTGFLATIVAAILSGAILVAGAKFAPKLAANSRQAGTGLDE